MDGKRQFSALKGLRLLVVEDEYIVAMDLQSYLEEQEAVVLGPVASVADALELIGAESDIDGAILDVNLRGEKVFGVADALRKRNVAFVFTTGYGQSAIPEAYADAPRCEKPVDLRQLQRALSSRCGSKPVIARNL